MIRKLCDRCHQRVAVIYVTRKNGNQVKNEGLCLPCARELGIKPENDILKKMGITEEDFAQMAEELNEMLPEIVPQTEDDEEGRAPALDLSAIFGNKENPLVKREAENQQKTNQKAPPKSRFLDGFCINLTQKARDGKLDNIIGRQTELTRVMQILCRRQKNNPCLIGEAGVGKTAIAELLAQRIASGNVPYKLRDKEVYLVDMTAIVAGTQFRGQFENRMKGLIDDVKRLGNIILVIDEIHSIVGAGSAEGSLNAANILKPALSRGEIQLIGATTLNEYRKYIENDAALERRFQPVMVNEPSIEDSEAILRGIKRYYEEYHGIRISDTIIHEIVRLSERYITDRYLPDKAIDLLDEASSHLAMNSPVINELESVSAELKGLNAAMEAIESKEVKTEEDYKTIADYKTRLIKCNERFDQLSASRDKLYLSTDDIAKVIEVWTGIPASNITENEFAKIDRMESEIKKRIIGQDTAVSRLARAIKRSRAGISYKRKPVSFIFAGSTGVGKTELVKVLANYLFDSPETLIRLDMSEFMEKHSVSRIIGSPPGYVGYDEAGQLTEKIRRKPYSVILFDEIEKAHPDVLNILLQILDDGRITDSHGKVCNFENTVIVMTTNAGSRDVSPSAGFSNTFRTSDEERVKKALEGFLRPEFINRVDDIIVFNRLTKENFVDIAMIMLNDLAKVLFDKGIKLTFTREEARLIAEKGYSEKYGARNLRRLIQTDIEDVAAAKIIDSYTNPVSEIILGLPEAGSPYAVSCAFVY
ncbi:MAG: ATP-dependent Clp protease ATP-binding subunit [Clostridiales bacterium]|jgi:ATP-dependent Clp protease ATP-binding subunit ClpA|nr:ATP-dependent Clp protease ATP-binding subunit [Clostridiales bacterium]